ncbi:dihydrodipicolinate synthase family protein [Mycolicibacterium litorale]|uniref:dihydrodipicolinate synthase family protein n=1 Tax=Mycolicibacterium litorale TaxID=758802 RepID=UPI003CF1E24D
MTTTLPTAGLTAVAVTPMTEDGQVDLASVGALMEFYIQCGVTGVALLGVMGEANRLTADESRQVLAAAAEAIDGRIPFLVGASDSSLERLTATARAAAGLGGAGVLVQPLTGLRGDDPLVGYFRAVTDALGPDIPVCYQDFPQSSDVPLTIAAWRRIVEDCPSVVMLKHEDVPGLGKLSAIRRLESEGLRRVTILAGNNGIALPQELDRGADGAMTGFAYPDVLVEVCRLHAAGEREAAEDLFDALLPLNRHELRGGISVRKEILRRRGVIATAASRHPARPLTEIDHRELDGLIARAERRSNFTAVDFGALAGAPR